MFTIEQINAANAKVSSGADFPAFIQDIIQLGVTHSDSFVTDGRTLYFGSNNYQIATEALYQNLPVAEEANVTQFKEALKTHQQGNTDFLTFCSDCARCGVDKWTVRIGEMTCTYYDKKGNALLTERIPVPSK